MSKNKKFYIYKITLLKGSMKGMYYIGKHTSTSLKDPAEDSYLGSGLLLKAYFKKYGKEKTYKKEIIELNNSAEENAQREKEIIGDLWKEDKKCLNLKGGGPGGGRKWSEEQRQKFIAANLGHKCSDTTKEKISQANTGKKRTEESKKIMSEKKKGKTTWMKGKHHTESAKQKNREAHLGKKHTEEWKRNMSILMKERQELKKVG